MTDTDTRTTGRKGSAKTNPETPADPATPTPTPTPDGAESAEKTAEKPVRKPAPDTSGIKAEDIQAAVVADVPELLDAGKPMRERTAEQKEMDTVVSKAYQRWVEADRPSQWAKMPVITYFLPDEKTVAAWVYLIKRGAQVVEPSGDSTGVRIHFGNQFTLSEERAAKIGRPDDAGKIVLMWAAIDKRKTAEDDKRKKTVEANQAAKTAGTAPEKPEG